MSQSSDPSDVLCAGSVKTLTLSLLERRIPWKSGAPLPPPFAIGATTPHLPSSVTSGEHDNLPAMRVHGAMPEVGILRSAR